MTVTAQNIGSPQRINRLVQRLVGGSLQDGQTVRMGGFQGRPVRITRLGFVVTASYHNGNSARNLTLRQENTGPTLKIMTIPAFAVGSPALLGHVFFTDLDILHLNGTTLEINYPSTGSSSNTDLEAFIEFEYLDRGLENSATNPMTSIA